MSPSSKSAMPQPNLHMIDAELLKILCCPETHQGLSFAPADAIQKLNQQISAGTARNRAGTVIKEPIEGGLLRADGKYLYPIRLGIPILLIDEALPP